MNSTPPAPQPDPSRGGGTRALVLGGGGSTGNAWLLGVVAGLHEAGLDLTAADLTVGTSAGATAAAQLGGAAPSDLLAAALVPPPDRSARSVAPGGLAGGPAGGPTPVPDHLARLRGTIAASVDAADFRRRMGAAALALDAGSDGSWQAGWRRTVAARLPAASWPDRPLLITAVDARTGEPVVLDRRSGVDLVDAVAASCASGRPYPVAGRPCIDGGYRSNAENADLAAGCGRVVVLSPLGGRSFTPVGWGTHLATQVDALRARGSRVEVVVPDPADAHLFGAAAMDLSLRPLAAEAGRDQGRRLVERLRVLWL